MTDHPFIQLQNVWRRFPAGESTVAVLKDINLTINKGEMVAIVGASGSGKSTLMNILGCLDRASEGSYKIEGKETGQRDADQLSHLRREYFGFIFQRYHLLGELSALGNVEIPAIYAGLTPEARKKRARALLERLGMGSRIHHRPGQLSGGQQQRVSIARALMNNAEIILADEPTGALDKSSGEDVLQILEELHREGRTIIIVTHDMSVAQRAERIIEISDGEIISDVTMPKSEQIAEPVKTTTQRSKPSQINPLRAFADRFMEAFQMAMLSMNAHRLRTFLTMLGIIIGIASVVSVVALGAGSTQQVLSNISGLGTNTLEIFPGKDFGDVRSGRITTLVVSDADALSRQTYAAAATPTVSTSSTVRFESREASALVNGVGDQYFAARGSKLSEGQFFTQRDVHLLAQDVVVDRQTITSLFPDLVGSAIGKVILIGSVPARIIGIVEPQQGGFGGSQNLNLYLPYTTVQTRFLGTTSLRSIILRISDDVSPTLAETAVTNFLTTRHGSKDFFIINTDDIRQTITATTQTMTLLIAAIAFISLLVGGIGVMNIMLVTVSERINEIGVRMAVGARQSDILQQFLIEAILVCLIGGITGIGLALSFGFLFQLSGAPFQLIYSSGSIITAFIFSTLIGICFGFLPAKNASKLDPVVALARD